MAKPQVCISAWILHWYYYRCIVYWLVAHSIIEQSLHSRYHKHFLCKQGQHSLTAILFEYLQIKPQILHLCRDHASMMLLPHSFHWLSKYLMGLQQCKTLMSAMNTINNNARRITNNPSKVNLMPSRQASGFAAQPNLNSLPAILIQFWEGIEVANVTGWVFHCHLNMSWLHIFASHPPLNDVNELLWN